MDNSENKTLGWGSFSLLLFAAGFLFSYLSVGKKSAGEHVLEYIKLNSIVAVVTVVLLLIAVTLGKRFKQHLFAKSGRVLSIILLSMFALAIIVGLIKVLIQLF